MLSNLKPRQRLRFAAIRQAEINFDGENKLNRGRKQLMGGTNTLSSVTHPMRLPSPSAATGFSNYHIYLTFQAVAVTTAAFTTFSGCY
jgi:hypothetical protein